MTTAQGPGDLAGPTTSNDRWTEWSVAAHLAMIRFKRRVQYRWRPAAYTDADPFKIISINPRSVTQQQRYVGNDSRLRPPSYPSPYKAFDKWRCLGYVLDGMWHEATTPLADLPVYQGLTSHFVDGVPWPETAFIRDVLAGRDQWHGEWMTEQEVRDRARRVDALYETIRQSGYAPRAGRGGTWRKAVDELTVNIGPHGEFIRNSAGMHRLVIAQVLGIARIPVRVLIRHRRWQDVRDKARRTNVVPPGYVGHPDLEDLAGR